jgi:hypothetical protein
MENEVEFTCSQVATMERLVHDALASVQHNILCPIRVGLRKREGILPVSSTTSSLLTCFFRALFPQLESQAEVTRAWGAIAAAEADRAMALLVAETSAREAAAAWDDATLRIKDAEDRATLAER